MPRAPAVLVIGGSGFLGRHVLDHLLRRGGAPVVALARDPAALDRQAWLQALRARPGAPPLTLVSGALDSRAWHAHPALAGTRRIVHLAAEVHHSRNGVATMQAANVAATGSMVALAAQLGARLVWTSSSGVVGCSRNAAAAPDESAPFCEAVVARWPYYASKVAAERAARSLADAAGVELVTLRPPMLLGPGDHRRRSTRQVARFLAGQVPFLLRGGIHYVDVRDVAAATVAALAHPTPRPIYHLPGTACGLDTFFGDLAAIADRPAPRVTLPLGVAHLLASADARLGRRLRGRPLGLLPDPVVIEMAGHYWGLSSAFAADELGFRPRVGYQTLQDTVADLQRPALA